MPLMSLIAILCPRTLQNVVRRLCAQVSHVGRDTRLPPVFQRATLKSWVEEPGYEARVFDVWI